MKNLLLIFSVLLSTSLSAVEYGYLSSSNANSSITLNSGDLLEFLGGESVYNIANAITVTLPNGVYFDVEAENLGLDYHSGGIGFLDTESTKAYVGPCTISTNLKYLAYRLTRVSEYQNSNVFSVLGDSNSTHNIVVETSTDLENWTPVHSSGLTGSSEQIYVRTRISTSE